MGSSDLASAEKAGGTCGRVWEAVRQVLAAEKVKQAARQKLQAAEDSGNVDNLKAWSSTAPACPHAVPK